MHNRRKAMFNEATSDTIINRIVQKNTSMSKEAQKHILQQVDVGVGLLDSSNVDSDALTGDIADLVVSSFLV